MLHVCCTTPHRRRAGWRQLDEGSARSAGCPRSGFRPSTSGRTCGATSRRRPPRRGSTPTGRRWGSGGCATSATSTSTGGTRRCHPTRSPSGARLRAPVLDLRAGARRGRRGRTQPLRYPGCGGHPRWREIASRPRGPPRSSRRPGQGSVALHRDVWGVPDQRQLLQVGVDPRPSRRPPARPGLPRPAPHVGGAVGPERRHARRADGASGAQHLRRSDALPARRPPVGMPRSPRHCPGSRLPRSCPWYAGAREAPEIRQPAARQASSPDEGRGKTADRLAVHQARVRRR